MSDINDYISEMLDLLSNFFDINKLKFNDSKELKNQLDKFITDIIKDVVF